jgi:hypothetical protein
MPAVDPARLAHEIERAFESHDDPRLLAQRVSDLLAAYSERARRPGGARTDALNVPRPVMNAVGRALASASDGGPASIELASALWSIPLRETRLLAAEALAPCRAEGAADWVESQAAVASDPMVLERLAGRGLSAYRAGDPRRALTRAGGWLRSSGARQRELGLIFLTAFVEEGTSEDLRQILSLLAGCPALGQGTERRALSNLLRALAQRTPQETVRYLADGVRAGSATLSMIARQILPRLTGRQQQILEEVLARGRASGIIPPSR